ncbi:hypothetical protein [Paenibacillus xylanexedens]|nr:hypothetical protein [Paenibacillus xylanexedens]
MLRPVDLLALRIEVTLSRGFNLRISPPAARQLRGDLALTSTGLSPASYV